jgi:hypothetical protein
MNAKSAQRPEHEVVEEVSKWTVGLGTLTFALFPLALPILALTAVAIVPLLVPVLVLGLLAAIVALPIRAIRRMLKRPARRATPQVIDPTRSARSAS